MHNYLKALKNTFNFSGRATPREYRKFILMHILICILLVVADAGLNYSAGAKGYNPSWVVLVFAYTTTITGLSAAVRRLHDAGKSPLWSIFWLIPHAYWLTIIVCARAGRDGVNKYGEPPVEI